MGDVEEPTKLDPLKQVRWIERRKLLQVTDRIIVIAQVKFISLNETLGISADPCVVFFFEGEEYVSFSGDTAKAVRLLLLED